MITALLCTHPHLQPFEQPGPLRSPIREVDHDRRRRRRSTRSATKTAVGSDRLVAAADPRAPRSRCRGRDREQQVLRVQRRARSGSGAEPPSAGVNVVDRAHPLRQSPAARHRMRPATPLLHRESDSAPSSEQQLQPVDPGRRAGCSWLRRSLARRPSSTIAPTTASPTQPPGDERGPVHAPLRCHEHQHDRDDRQRAERDADRQRKHLSDCVPHWCAAFNRPRSRVSSPEPDERAPTRGQAVDSSGVHVRTLWSGRTRRRRGSATPAVSQRCRVRAAAAGAKDGHRGVLRRGRIDRAGRAVQSRGDARA